MMWFVSDFDLPNGSQSFSEIWAASLGDAQKIAEKRGFRNVRRKRGPVKEMRPSVLAEQRGLDDPSILHAVCFIGFLAARSGTVTAEDLVADDSPLHELGHYLHGGENMRGGNMTARVIERFRWLEKRTPGLPG